jgi:hypothetical protein
MQVIGINSSTGEDENSIRVGMRRFSGKREEPLTTGNLSEVLRYWCLGYWLEVGDSSGGIAISAVNGVMLFIVSVPYIIEPFTSTRQATTGPIRFL